MLPSPELLNNSIYQIKKAFENTVHMESVRVRWEEIKRIQVQPALVSN